MKLITEKSLHKSNYLRNFLQLELTEQEVKFFTREIISKAVSSVLTEEEYLYGSNVPILENFEKKIIYINMSYDDKDKLVKAMLNEMVLAYILTLEAANQILKEVATRLEIACSELIVKNVKPNQSFEAASINHFFKTFSRLNSNLQKQILNIAKAAGDQAETQSYASSFGGLKGRI